MKPDSPRMTVWRMHGNAGLLSTVLRKRLSEMFYIKQHGAAQNAVGSCHTLEMRVSVFSVVDKFCSLEVLVGRTCFLGFCPF